MQMGGELKLVLCEFTPICFYKGHVGEVFGRLKEGVEKIESKIPFSSDERLGMLTFCPTNLGTTIRAR